jgi:ribokinase
MQAGVPGGAALILIGGGGENCIAVAPGANDRLTPQMVPSFEPLLRGAAMLILQYELLPETLYACIDLGHALGVPVMFNLAPARPFDPAYLAKVACLVLNESEAEALCGFPVDMPERVEQAAGDLLARGAGTVILTLGAAGAFLASTGLRQKVPAFRVEPVDTTAAGDVFCGALAVALVEGRPLPEAARFACAASAISVTRMGAQPSVPERAEIDAFLERNQA